jgi:hypothetical protein
MSEEIVNYANKVMNGIEVRITEYVPDDPETGEPRDTMIIGDLVLMKPSAYEAIKYALKNIPEEEVFKKLNEG